ncbi:MAG: ATP-binding protein, partial [Candidatus Eremiobacteraeota bacterium]|nr:ATP-binding protein [Candidatus Eremiobacteraeota bacterium]
KALLEKHAELEHANLTKDTFLAGMSHELRTPLNAIIGFTGTLIMKLPGPLTPDQEQQLGIIQSSARHLLSLINDILDLAKIESGKVELHFEPVVVRHVMDEVSTSLSEIAMRKGLSWQIRMPDAELPILTDRRALRQILTNLVSNAIKYTAAGSIVLEVLVSRENENEAIRINVIDTGIGIRLEDQEKLFQAFMQVDTSNTRRFEGAGLGLYLSEKLCKLLGARLSATSEFGKGSTFTLTLPKEPQ